MKKKAITESVKRRAIAVGPAIKIAILISAVMGMLSAAHCWAGALSNPYGEISVDLNLQQLNDQPVYFALGRPGIPHEQNEGHTSNAGFVVTAEGVVVYDALGTPSLGFALLKAIRQTTEMPIRYVVVGHYHSDHIYGLQAFAEHTDATIIAHEASLEYAGSADAPALSEAAQRRLAQRRNALHPWINKRTKVIAPSKTFSDATEFVLGGLRFELLPLGPAHSTSDTALLMRSLGVVFSGDLIFGGRVPFLDSPDVDTGKWLKGLETLSAIEPKPTFIVPGHGKASNDLQARLQFTQTYIEHVRHAMAAAVSDFIPFDEAYEQTDWSAYGSLPAFDATNRRNAYRVYLEMEAAELD